MDIMVFRTFGGSCGTYCYKDCTALPLDMQVVKIMNKSDEKDEVQPRKKRGRRTDNLCCNDTCT